MAQYGCTTLCTQMINYYHGILTLNGQKHSTIRDIAQYIINILSFFDQYGTLVRLERLRLTKGS